MEVYVNKEYQYFTYDKDNKVNLYIKNQGITANCQNQKLNIYVGVNPGNSFYMIYIKSIL